MKIRCDYCGNYYDDSKDNCPKCGASSKCSSEENDITAIEKNSDSHANKKIKKPKTIIELQKWYKDRNLPSSKVTRFYIGENTKTSKAFGIYKDGTTGNFIVYKNKASGERAIHYEGTDEAYAVNEIFKKLKEHITVQKNLQSGTGQNVSVGSRSGLRGISLPSFDFSAITSSRAFRVLGGYLLYFLIMPVLTILFILIVGIFCLIFDNEPKEGYYRFEDELYYYSSDDYISEDMNWYHFLSDSGEWSAPINLNEMPKEMREKKTSKPYLLDNDWNADYGCTDFESSVFYQDIQKGFWTSEGYYKCDDYVFFHIYGLNDNNWYYFNKEWSFIEKDELPLPMQHSSTVVSYFISEDDCSSLNVDNFKETVFYKDYENNYNVGRGYYSYDDNYYYHLEDNYENGWYYYEPDNEWVEISADDIPDDLKHNSKAVDFYYTPSWNEETQISDFEDTDFYSDYVSDKNADNWDDDDDDYDYDWDDDYDWDNDSFDWDSDW